MKRLYALALGALALTASAFDPGQQFNLKTFRSAIPSAAPATTLHPTQAAQAAQAEPQHSWVDMGQSTMVDDLTPCYFMDIEPTSITVDVQKDAANEGWYRIVNPWKNYPQELLDIVTAAGGTLTQTDEITIVIDASNPEYVRILETNIGMDDGYGASTIVGYTELVGMNLGIGVISQEEADKKAGKLVDNVIVMSERYAFMFHQGDSYYNGNSNGKFTLALPGEEIPIDYSLKAAPTTKFCPEADGKYHLTFVGDERIPGVKYICSPEYPETQQDIEHTIESLRTEGKLADVNSTVDIDISGATGSEYFVFFCSINENGELTDDMPYAIAFWVPDTDTEGWTSLGNATMTEGFMACVMPGDFRPEDYQVEVQRNIAQPGLFRIVNPYNPWTQGQQYLSSHGHNHYIYFNADDHDNVYIMESGLGLSMASLGEAGVGSLYYNMVRQYGIDFLLMFGITSGGFIKDNVLTFDGTNEIQVFFAGLGKWYYANIFNNPDFKENEDPESERYLPGDFKLDMTGLDLSGIHDIAGDDATDAPAEYLNLQGMRVQRPEKGAVYIMRRGGTTAKVMIR